MSKTSLLLPLVTLLILLAATPAQALTILIDNQGQMVVQQDQVLGDENESESENETAKAAAEQQREQEKKQAEQQREQAKTAAEREREQQKTNLERTREQNKTNLEQKREAAKKLRTVNSSEKKQLKVKTDATETEVLIEDTTARENQFTNQEVMRTQRLDIELPANEKPETELEDESETETETSPESETLRKIREDRQQRQDRLQIRTRTTTDGESEVEIESGDSSARLKSAEFSVNPETNEVTVITPSGQTHTLLHLPDVAIQRMTDAGVVNPSDSQAEAELTVETSADGSVVYKTKAKQVRRILGIVPVEFENEVELDDATSQVTTTPTNESLFMQLLRSISR